MIIHQKLLTNKTFKAIPRTNDKVLEFPIEDEFLVLDKAWFYQNKISNVDNEYMALSQEIRFPFNNKLRLATDLINLSGLTEISH